jgi:hypothetical protein
MFLPWSLNCLEIVRPQHVMFPRFVDLLCTIKFPNHVHELTGTINYLLTSYGNNNLGK